jgi:putative ABC transport system permease protein
MEIREHLRQAAEATASHPRRAIASSMGVFWGAAAIVLLLAWGSGFRSYMYGELQSYGRPMIFMVGGITSSGFPGHRPGVRIEISRDDIAAAERATPELVDAILPEHLVDEGDRVLVRAGHRVRRLDVSGVDERFAGYRKFEIGAGRFFDRSDVAHQRNVAVLGHEAAGDLFGDAGAAVGRRIRVEGHSFRVIGVADPKGTQYFNTNRPDNRLLMIPITTSEVRLGFHREDVERINVYPRPGASAEEVVGAIVANISERAGFHPEDTDAMRFFDLTDILGMIELIHAGFLVFVGVAGTITLLVAGVGIANFHLATLAERTVEIGVAKAIGARNRVLVVQAVIESLLVSSSAAGLGVATGVGACAALSWLAPPGLFPMPVISSSVIGITLGALVGVAAVAAVVPALRVRRMDVSAALRTAA